MTIGSLFDGIGGFPLAAKRCGITPVWASEIEPSPMSVTRERFPDMTHLGDVTRIDGAAIPAVDIITGGSPCQDLSVAGKRAGLDGKRSGLFMDQVRIIKEMRERDKGDGRSGKHVRPRIMVWENVPGALSSKKGEDFRAVLEETSRIADDTVHIPRPARGKWNTAGSIVGDGYSIAWRIMDAQYWGVPQRRRRIFLVADFGGGRAGEILFEPEGLRGDTETGCKTGEAIAANHGTGIKTANCKLYENHGQDSRITGPLVIAFSAGQGAKAGGIGAQVEVAPTLRASESGTNMVPVVIFPETYHTITACNARNAESAQTPNCIVCAIPINDKATRFRRGGKSRNDDGAGNGIGIGVAGGPSPTISCGDRHMVMVMSTGQAGAESLHSTPPVRCGLTVRRLMPIECERLQGFPDGWADIGTRQSSDTARYKALGNSVAIPCVEYIMRRIVSVIGKEQKSC